ncbi:MAG TPA: YhcH/YjgK/YiaL family protein [Clostridiales bacterium]|nr:YhcH/YjgK/YiaL family protein [Clostridiales bacterium]
MVIDSIQNVFRYYGMGDTIKLALELLSETDFSKLQPGKYEVDGSNLYYMVQNYKTRNIDECIWEAHKKYIDIQYIVDGQENIGYSNINQLAVKKQYDEISDAVLLEGSGSIFTINSGFFVIFNPEDAHMPCISSNNNLSNVKKIVVKIKI